MYSYLSPPKIIIIIWDHPTTNIYCRRFSVDKRSPAMPCCPTAFIFWPIWDSVPLAAFWHPFSQVRLDCCIRIVTRILSDQITCQRQISSTPLSPSQIFPHAVLLTRCLSSVFGPLKWVGLTSSATRDRSWIFRAVRNVLTHFLLSFVSRECFDRSPLDHHRR